MSENNHLLQVKNLKTFFPSGRNWFGKQKYVKAVNGVSLHINRNEIVGLVGESGSGKTTLGRSILRLVENKEGEIIFDDYNLQGIKGAELRNIRRKMQLIFQDPYSSLSPRMQIGKIIAEPLLLHKMVPKNSVETSVIKLLKEVGLEPYFKDRYPHEMSGGQRQRIAIARVLALQPQLIVADEPVSALDVSVTAQILNLLKSIQKKNEMSMLFISHDLKVIGYIANRILVMYAGHIVEEATTNELLSSPLHPYTKLLISSIPGMKNRNSKSRSLVKKIASINNFTENGCPFFERCAESQNICKEVNPPIKESKVDRFVACHFN